MPMNRMSSRDDKLRQRANSGPRNGSETSVLIARSANSSTCSRAGEAASLEPPQPRMVQARVELLTAQRIERSDVAVERGTAGSRVARQPMGREHAEPGSKGARRIQIGKAGDGFRCPGMPRAEIGSG